MLVLKGIFGGSLKIISEKQNNFRRKMVRNKQERTQKVTFGVFPQFYRVFPGKIGLVPF